MQVQSSRHKGISGNLFAVGLSRVSWRCSICAVVGLSRFQAEFLVLLHSRQYPGDGRQGSCLRGDTPICCARFSELCLL